MSNPETYRTNRPLLRRARLLFTSCLIIGASAMTVAACAAVAEDDSRNDSAQLNDAPNRMERLLEPRAIPDTPKPKIVKIEVTKSTKIDCDFASILAAARGTVGGKPAPTTIPFKVNLDRAKLNLPDNEFANTITGATVSGTIDYSKAPDIKITGIKVTATMQYRSSVTDFDTTITVLDGANASVPAKGGGKITDLDFKLEASGLGTLGTAAYDALVFAVKKLGILPSGELSLNAQTVCFTDTYKFTTEGGATFTKEFPRGEISLQATWTGGSSMPFYITLNGTPGTTKAVVVRQSDPAATPTLTVPAK